MFSMIKLGPWIALAFVLSVLAALGYGYFMGYSDADQSHKVAELEATIAEMERQAKATENVLKDAQLRQQESEKRLAAARGAQSAYERQIDELTTTVLNTVQSVQTVQKEDGTTEIVCNPALYSLTSGDLEWVQRIRQEAAGTKVAPDP